MHAHVRARARVRSGIRSFILTDTITQFLYVGCVEVIGDSFETNEVECDRWDEECREGRNGDALSLENGGMRRHLRRSSEQGEGEMEGGRTGVTHTHVKHHAPPRRERVSRKVLLPQARASSASNSSLIGKT